MNNNLLKRIFTAIIIAIFILSIIFLGKTTLLLGILFMSSVSIYELNRALKNMDLSNKVTPLIMFNCTYLYMIYRYQKEYILEMIFLFVIFIILNSVFNKNHKIETSFSAIFIIVYISLPYSFLLLINNKIWILFAFVVTSVTDIFAYTFGILLGKHKLIERLSPKKTIEGAIGGVLGALLLSYLFVKFFDFPNKILLYLSIILISIMSQIGDLFASLIKRRAEIKDYGTFLIGHGGVLDRFDSLLLVSPFIYLLFNLIQ